jgi:hypothetical protein
MAGGDVITAILVPRDHRDGVRLDDQVGGQSPRLIGGSERGHLIRISDGDQISHGVPLLLPRHCLPPCRQPRGTSGGGHTRKPGATRNHRKNARGYRHHPARMICTAKG